VATSGNMRLQISIVGASTEYLWLYTQGGVDYSAKSLRMTFTDGVLSALTDGYFLFTVADATVHFDSIQAQTIAENYVKGMTWNINGTQTSDFNPAAEVSIQMLPHPRSDSVALVPYWYIVMPLDRTYAGGFNIASVGVWADSGEIADAQLLNG
jgi:hypothetical protein